MRFTPHGGYLTNRGRPRRFDPEEALDAAMAVFWSHGFDATSMADLSAATGLNKPSLYAAFGDKAQLFRQALERYAKTQAEPHLRALEREPDVRAAIGAFLASLADVLADPAKPGGCFIVNATAACGTGDLPSSVETAVHQAHALTGEAIRPAGGPGGLPAHRGGRHGRAGQGRNAPGRPGSGDRHGSGRHSTLIPGREAAVGTVISD
jgi:AcrR family transcriptional regulator